MNQQKIVQTIAVIGAGFIATKLIDVLWKQVFGHRPPTPGNEEDSPVREIVLFAAVSGAIVALARSGAARAAHKYSEKRASS